MKSLNTMHFKFSKSTGKWPTDCVTVFMYFYSAGAVVMHKEKSLHPQAPSTPVSNTVDILGNICSVYQEISRVKHLVDSLKLVFT